MLKKMHTDLIIQVKKGVLNLLVCFWVRLTLWLKEVGIQKCKQLKKYTCEIESLPPFTRSNC